MQITRLIKVVHDPDYTYLWPSGDAEPYPNCIDFQAAAHDGPHEVRVGIGKREVYGQVRERVVVWIDEYPRAEFFGADDFAATGDVLCVIKIGKRECRYPDHPIPERYAMFNVVGLPNRVNAKGVHNAWAVVANIADFRTMAALAGLRVRETENQGAED